MYQAVASYQNPVVIELGVRTGFSTAALLAAVHLREGVLWSADIGSSLAPPEWHEDPRWHFLKGDDLEGMVQKWLPLACQVLFIDTSHDYRHTLAELRLYAHRVRPGGIILLHDTHWVPGDGELAGPDGPVAKALDTYCEDVRLTWEDRPGSYGMGVIRK